MNYEEIKKQLQEEVVLILCNFGIKAQSADVTFEITKYTKFGDISCNCSMKFAKTLDKNPLTLSKKIVDQLNSTTKLLDYFSEITAVKPGFINARLRDNVIFSIMQDLYTSEPDPAGSDVIHKRMVIDYSSPNIAKRFGVGHLRSTIIGDSIRKIYQNRGWEAIGDNHIGDWGTQFGQIINAIKKWESGKPENLTIPELEALYVRYNLEAETNPELITEARNQFKLLEKGEVKTKEIWSKIVKSSMEEFDRIYDLLNVEIENVYGESFYEKMLDEITADCINSPKTKESAGAVIFEFDDEKIPPAMVRKSDGTSTYFLRDLASIKFRVQKWNPDIIVYEVGSEQKLHFKQVFRASHLLGYISEDALVHIPHGLLSLPEGKMSTRKGRTVKLETIIEQAIEKASVSKSNKKAVNQIALGAIKYNDLKRNPEINYVFRVDEAINLEGDSSTYIQYTGTRIKSLLKNSFDVPAGLEGSITIEERELILHLHEFVSTIEVSAERFNPSTMCVYLYTLAKKYNRFYTQSKIIVDDMNVRNFRLQLSSSTLSILEEGLGLLGIEIPDEM